MKRIYRITIICSLFMILLTYGLVELKKYISKEKDSIRVGFIYVGDSCDAYTNNFIKAQKAIEKEYGERVELLAKYNVAEGKEEVYIKELVEAGCDLIFATSYGYGETVKRIAADYPEIQFCMATCSNANEQPVLPNYHNFMGEIYQGRYISGVVAGMKIKELIEEGTISGEQVKIGYVGAFPYAEVISGYTAFFLGARSVVPNVEMEVVYTDSWGDYDLEKRLAFQLIEDGCVIISQHSDTSGPAVACEEMRGDYVAFHVGYNLSMADVAPITSIISSRIDWQKYMVAATGAVLKGKKIEDAVDGNVHGNDISGGFKEEWVQMLKLNATVAAKGTEEVIQQLIQQFCQGDIDVYRGDYVGVDPFNPEDTFDLRKGFQENRDESAPSFHYVLKDVIHISE